MQYRDLGGKGKKIVMLPGWGFGSKIWNDFAVVLSNNYQVRMVDLPGMGMNKDVKALTLNSVLEKLASIMPDHTIVLGWSFGAMLGALLGVQYKSKISQVIMLNGSLKVVGENSYCSLDHKTWNIIWKYFFKDPVGFLQWFAKQQLEPSQYRMHYNNILRNLRDNYDIDSGQQLKLYLKMMSDIDLRESIKDINLTYIQSRNDKVLPPIYNAKSCSYLSKANVISLADGCHAAFINKQTNIAKIIRDIT